MANNNPQYKSYRFAGFELVAEITPDGRKILRRIKLLSRYRKEFELPADAAGIEILPENSVGSTQIKDEDVKLQDLDKDIQDKLDRLDDANIMLPEEATSRVQDIIGSLDSEYNSQNAGNDANGETADPEDI